MNPRASNTPHVVYLMDLELPLTEMLTVLADVCDEDGMFGQTDLVIMALNMLTVSHCVNDAVEAMTIEVSMFCRYRDTPFVRERLMTAIRRYMTAMHDQFQSFKLYGEDEHLRYTFGGWHAPYVPLFVPYTHLRNYPQAISAIVGGEPLDPHPSKVFRYPFPASEIEPHLPF